MLAIQLVLLAAMLIFTVIVRWRLRNEEGKKVAEVSQVGVFMAASEDVIMPEVDGFDEYSVLKPSSFGEYKASPPSFEEFKVSPPGGSAAIQYECALCSSPTSTRCSRCKAVRYCSSKCQIMHWRQGHKYECHPPPNGGTGKDVSLENGEVLEQNETNHSEFAVDVETLPTKTVDGIHYGSPDSHTMIPRLSTVAKDHLDFSNGASSPGEHGMRLSDNNKLRGKKKNNTMDVNMSSESMSNGVVNSKKLSRDKSTESDRRKSGASSSDMSLGLKKNKSPEGIVSENVNWYKPSEVPGVGHLQNEGDGHGYPLSKHMEVKPLPSAHSGDISLQPRSRSSLSRLPHLGFKSSLQKVVHNMKASHHKKPPHHSSLLETSVNPNHKATIQYRTFVELYTSDEVELKPFGLVNCGNSCYANAVLQCLAYTRPLTLYLLQGLHSKECWKEEWCFICEFERLIRMANEGYTPLSPIRILSNVSHLGHGRQEDAHEFLRYAVDTMQSVCIQLARSVGTGTDESTLISMTFGGYLHSKIKCMKCQYKSDKYERMMDLTVEIDGDIRTLDQALKRFTALEILEGKNKYFCSRCKSYEKAKKKLSVFQAPNVLTIALKRFQAGALTKLNKLVRFPLNLDMTPFMSRSSDRSSLYNLYAVVVHLDVKSAAFCGHYVCYVKNYHDVWFKIDDSVVTSVDLERVLSEEAYILLYARQSPMPTASANNASDGKPAETILHAVPSSIRDKSAIPKVRRKSSDHLAIQHSSSRNGYAKDPSYLEEWVTHSVASIPRGESSSEVSSIFSNSEEGTCSTPSTKASVNTEDYSNYIFGGGVTRF